MRKILVLVVLVSLGLNISLGVRLLKGTCGFPQIGGEKEQFEGPMHPGEPGPGGGGGSGRGRDGAFWRSVMERRLAHVTEQLGLNEEQAEAFKKTHQEAAEGFLAQRVKVQDARQNLMDAASAEEFSVEALRYLIADVGRQQVKLDSMVTETMLQEMEIMDDDQRREYIRILPVNRFGGRSGAGGPGAERGSGRRRH